MAKVALMITIFKTIGTIGGGIYFVSIIFTGMQHFAKTYQKITKKWHILWFLQILEIYPPIVSMVSSLTWPNLHLNTKNLHPNALLSLPRQLKVVILDT